MKKLIVILAIAAVSKISAQPTVTFPYLGTPHSITFIQGWERVDSGLLNALKDTILAPVRQGEQRFRVADSTLYIAQSTVADHKWFSSGSGGGGGANWSLTGNSGTNTSTNFLGATDSVRSFQGKIFGHPISYVALPYTWFQSLGNAGAAMTTLGYRAGEALIAKDIISPSSDTVCCLTGRQHVIIGNNAGENMGNKIDPDSSNRQLQSTVLIGSNAAINLQYGSSTDYGRTVVIGTNACFTCVEGEEVTVVGSYAMERGSKGVSNTAVGTNALRTIVNGSFNTVMGQSAGYHSSGTIAYCTITNGGSGYTTATVTISAPRTYGLPNMPGICETQATAHAVIQAGVITSIIIDDPGCGYSSTNSTTFTNGTNNPPTVTITGDGVNAAATATVTNADNNTYIGYVANWFYRSGQYNTALGSIVGNSVTRYADTGTTLLGALAQVATYVPLTTNLTNATAVGYKAQIAQSNTLILGDTAVDTKVGIGTLNPDSSLTVQKTAHVKGNAAVNGLLTVKSSDGSGITPSIVNGPTGNQFRISGRDSTSHLWLFGGTSPTTSTNSGSAYVRLDGANGGGGGELGYKSTSNITFYAVTPGSPTTYNGALRAQGVGNISVGNKLFVGDLTTVPDSTTKIGGSLNVTTHARIQQMDSTSSPVNMVYQDVDGTLRKTSPSGPATFIVAASNSPTKLKARADYICDGTSDEVEIKAALALGNVQLVEGTYNISDSIHIPDHRSMIGTGEATILKSAIGFLGKMLTSTGGGQAITLMNFSIDGRDSTGYGIYFELIGSGSGSTSVMGSKIANLWIHNIYQSGIELQSCRNSTIDNVKGTNCHWDAVVLKVKSGQAKGCVGVTISNGIYRNNTAAIWSQGTENSSFTGNLIEGDSTNARGQIGIQCELNCTGLVISNNVVKKNAEQNLDIDATTNSVISNNIFDSTFASYGVFFQNGSSGNTFTNNRVTNSWDNGVEVSGSGETLLSNNFISSNGRVGGGGFYNMEVVSTDNQIINNVFRKGSNPNTPDYGLRLSAGAVRALVQNNDFYQAGNTGDISSVSATATIRKNKAFDGGPGGYFTTAVSTTLTSAMTEGTMNVTATGQTITLPTAASIAGRTYTIKLTASGSATVATTSSQTIDASTTYSLSAQYKYVTVQSNGANWIVIANNGLWLIFLLALPLAAAATCAETKVVKIFANKKAA